MALRFHPLPLGAFPDEARPSLARMNAELRDLFALEGTIRKPLSIQKSDSTVVRKSTPQVHITRITPDITSVVAGVSAVIGTPALTLGLVNTIGTTNTVVSVNSAVAIFDATAPEGVSNSSGTGTAAFAARRDHFHDLGIAGNSSYIRQDGTLPFTGNQSMGGFDLNNIVNLDHSSNPLVSFPGTYTWQNDTGTAIYKFTDVSDNDVTISVANAPAIRQIKNLTAGTASGDGLVHSLNPINHLLAATADYSMGGFGFTNVDDIRSVAATLLEFVVEDSSDALAEAFRINWDRNSASVPTNADKFLSVGYTDDADVYQEAFAVEQMVGFPGIRLGGGYGSRGVIGFGTSASPKTTLTLRDANFEFRVNGKNAFRVSHTGVGGGLAEWSVLDSDQFAFQFNSGAVDDTNANDDALWRFRCDPGTASSPAGVTRGDFLQVDNNSVDLFVIDHAGSITSTNKIRQTTDDANQLSAEKSFFTIDAGINTWEVDTTYTNQRYYRFNIPTLTINTTKTVTTAATVYIEGAPTNGGAGTLTTALSLWVDAGDAKFDEAVLAYESRDVVRYALMGA